MLADLVRSDRLNHRQVVGDSPLAEGGQGVARAHQSLIWARQRHVNALRRTAPQLAAPEPVEGAYRQVVDALVGTLCCLSQQIVNLEQPLAWPTAEPAA